MNLISYQEPIVSILTLFAYEICNPVCPINEKKGISLILPYFLTDQSCVSKHNNLALPIYIISQTCKLTKINEFHSKNFSAVQAWQHLVTACNSKGLQSQPFVLNVRVQHNKIIITEIILPYILLLLLLLLALLLLFLLLPF